MTAAALLVAGLLCGLAWARGGVVGTWPERLSAAAVVGVLAASWAAWLWTVTAGYRVALVAAPVSLLLVAAALAKTGGGPRTGVATEAVPRELRAAWLTCSGLASLVLAWLFSTHYLPSRDGGGMGSAGSTWGDLALHASLASRFAQQTRFDWEFSLLHGTPLAYPFLPDFLSGVLHRGGWSLRWALLAPSLLLAFALVQLLLLTAWRATGSVRAAVGAFLLVLLGGSAAGLVALRADWREHRLGAGSLASFVIDLPRDYAHVPQINLRFSNLVCDALVPQRGMLAGLAVVLVALLLLRQAWGGKEMASAGDAGSADEGASAAATDADGATRRPLLAVGLLLGALPFVHVHSFLVLAGLLVWLAAARLVAASREGGGGPRGALAARWRQALAGERAWLVAPLLGVVLAAPQLAWQLAHAGGASFSHWRLGWMAEPGEDPFAFWLRNLGALTPFLVVAPWLLRHWRGFWLQVAVALLLLFPIANVYQFQPHAYDNLKLLFYAYLALCWVAARALAAGWERGGWRRPLAAACLLLGTASGTLSVWREATLHEPPGSPLAAGWPFLDAEEVRLAMELRRATPPEARFLTADRHNHPVPVLAGRPIVLGYRGWLWTHGADASRHLRDVRAIYAGEPAARELLARYDVSYVVVGPHERRAFDVDDGWLERELSLLLATERYRVYRVAGSKTSASAGSQRDSRSASK